MIAFGGLIAGVGFVEHADTHARAALGSNLWFDLGLGTAILGAVLSIVTVILIIMESHKSRQFEALIADLAAKGRVIDTELSTSEAQRNVMVWTYSVRDAIRSAIGPAEADLFMSDAGFTAPEGLFPLTLPAHMSNDGSGALGN